MSRMKIQVPVNDRSQIDLWNGYWWLVIDTGQ